MVYVPAQVAHWINDAIKATLTNDINSGDLDPKGARLALIWLNEILVEEVKQLKKELEK